MTEQTRAHTWGRMKISRSFDFVQCLSSHFQVTTERRNPLYTPHHNVMKALFKNKFEVVRALEQIIPVTEYEKLCAALVGACSSYKNALKLMQFFIRREVRDTKDQDTLFRGSCLASSLVTNFCLQEGLDYLQQILLPCLHMLFNEDGSIEIDPARAEPTVIISENQTKLMGICKGLLHQHIARSAEECNLHMRQLFAILRKETRKKFPDMEMRAISNAFFLRFLCPALISPDCFGLTKFLPDAKHKRSLILVAKIVQNLANDAEFGEKESYMVPLNDFIKSNQPVMQEFLSALSDPATLESNRDSQMRLNRKEVDPFTTLQQLLLARREQLCDVLSEDAMKLVDTCTNFCPPPERVSAPPSLNGSEGIQKPEPQIVTRKRSKSCPPKQAS